MLNIGTPARYLSDGLYRKTIGSLAGGRAREDPQWVAEHGTVRLSHKPSIRGYTKQLLSLSTWSGFPLLGRINHPVLVVAGDDDPLTPVANGMIIAHLLPNGRLLLMRGEGHLMLLDDTSGAHPPIREFLECDDLPQAQAWRLAQVVSPKRLQLELSTKMLQIQPWPWGLAGSYQRHRWLK
jgi:pimeloyl-ACP methyl ester carboxylesterase